ncbi:glycosyltransferase family 4 protein [Azotobacter beijerinckii]|uniref:glycosyltransferase family 4 protein n=1 Tax=Azotobacter beijerinckii TaxID=170623 RepID=UPI0029556030|nr:glycosyltransferase family 4 protein [Azotobacter beijerinckii]MDV7212377.1 glycosyltransferase family 4 protein [Azotobacter beijerinckii]
MKVLFLHQNFPGQFRHIAVYLARQADADVLAIGREQAPGLPGVQSLRYKPHRTASPHTDPYACTLEERVLHGQQVLRLLLDLKGRGYRPDVVVAHPGWGESLYVKEPFPTAKLIHFCEYYYQVEGDDLDFDPEFPASIDDKVRVRSRNALHLLNLESCDLGITPTHWQHSLHPAAYRDKIKVIHEGIDTAKLGPDPMATLSSPNGRVLRAGEPIATYVARNLEPYRSFHIFMCALPRILREHPTCQVVVVGGDDVSYGSRPKDAPNWRGRMLRENPVDPERVHFLGKVPYEIYKRALQVSAVHVYLTCSFVLSWSLLEAMACGCLIVGSDTVQCGRSSGIVKMAYWWTASIPRHSPSRQRRPLPTPQNTPNCTKQHGARHRRIRVRWGREIKFPMKNQASTLAEPGHRLSGDTWVYR